MSLASSASRSRLPHCAICGTPLPPGSFGCSSCVARPRSTEVRSHVGASPSPAQAALRFVSSLAVDFLLGVFTLGLGWLVWALFLLPRSQTPAGRMFQLRIVDVPTLDVPGLAKQLFRLVMVFLGGVYLVAGALWGYGLLVDIGPYWVNSRAIPAFVLGLIVIDMLALALPGRRRLIDRILGLGIRTHAVKR